MTYPHFFAQPPGETSHDYTLCFSTAVAAAPPSASHPRRPRRDAAAFCGSERPRRRGRAADLCRGHGGRGQQRRPWPRKGFRVVLGVALTRWRKGFVHWQVIFVLCFGILSGTCCLNPLFVMGWASWNSGVRNGQTWRAKAWVERKAEGCRRRLATGQWRRNLQLDLIWCKLIAVVLPHGYSAIKATDISQWKREGGVENVAHENVGQQAE